MTLRYALRGMRSTGKCADNMRSTLSDSVCIVNRRRIGKCAQLCVTKLIAAVEFDLEISSVSDELLSAHVEATENDQR